MKNNKIVLKQSLTCFIVVLCSLSAQAQIETVGCFTSWGDLIKPGYGWDEVYNGVKYRCTCNGNGSTDCVPASSSSSSNNSGSTDLNGQIMQSLVEPLIQNFFDWIFAPSSSSQDDQQEELTAEDLERMKAES